MKKLFWKDPYQTELTTHITSVDANQVTLKETIFFAFSGGQESDAGTIGGFNVLEAKAQGADIVYTLDGNPSFKVGDEVHVLIDWTRRYKLMRLHFATEIILELAYKHLPDIEKIGAHIAEDKSRIDFVWGENISKAFPLFEQEANNLIAADLPIQSDFSDEVNGRRFWKIDGFSKVACGGTHLKRTREIGKLRLKRVNIGKGKERVEIYVTTPPSKD